MRFDALCFRAACVAMSFRLCRRLALALRRELAATMPMHYRRHSRAEWQLSPGAGFRAGGPAPMMAHP